MPLGYNLEGLSCSESKRVSAGLQDLRPVCSARLCLKAGEATGSRENPKQSLDHADRYSAGGVTFARALYDLLSGTDFIHHLPQQNYRCFTRHCSGSGLG